MRAINLRPRNTGARSVSERMLPVQSVKDPPGRSKLLSAEPRPQGAVVWENETNVSVFAKPGTEVSTRTGSVHVRCPRRDHKKGSLWRPEPKQLTIYREGSLPSGARELVSITNRRTTARGDTDAVERVLPGSATNVRGDVHPRHGLHSRGDGSRRPCHPIRRANPSIGLAGRRWRSSKQRR